MLNKDDDNQTRIKNEMRNPRMQLRPAVATLSVVALCSLSILSLTSCEDKPPKPPDKVRIVNGTDYFPMNDGDTWYYNSGNFVRKVDGDTVIDGQTCKRVLLATETDQAWSLTAERFAVHLLLGYMWVDPPLDIPLNLVKDEPHSFNSLGLITEGFVSDADSFRIFGTLTFAGYVTRTISQVDLDSCLQLDYISTTKIYFKNGNVIDDVAEYSEFYARGIGMIYDGTWGLDAALINGVQLPKSAP